MILRRSNEKLLFQKMFLCFRRMVKVKIKLYELPNFPCQKFCFRLNGSSPLFFSVEQHFRQKMDISCGFFDLCFDLVA